MSRLSPLTRQSGLTLLELLIAITLFSAVGAITTLILNQSLNSADKLETRNEALIGLQTGLVILEQDFTQIAQRNYKTPLGNGFQRVDPLSTTDGRYRYLIQFVKAGDFERGTKPSLVRYRVEEQRLLREVNPVIDGYKEGDWRSATLISPVSDVKINFFYQGQWQEQLRTTVSANQAVPLPEAVKIQFEHVTLGHIEKLVQLPASEVGL